MKKYCITLSILVLLWVFIWGMLFNYEKTFPNSTITKFSQFVFKDLKSFQIVKNLENDEFFDVYKNGEKLMKVLAKKEDEFWRVEKVEQYIEPIRIFAPINSKVYVEEKLLDYNDVVEYVADNKYSLIDNKELAPKIECYEVNGYFNIPKIKVVFNDLECDLEVENRNVNAFINLSEDEKKNLNDIVEDVGKLYSRYISGDAYFAQISPKLYNKTDFYKEVRNFYNGWYDHTGYDIRDVNVYELKKTSETSFYGDISFNYIIKKGAKEFEYPSNYRIYFMKEDANWKAISIETK